MVYEWVEADLNDVPKLTLSFPRHISHVYHCAALISFDPSDYKLLRKTNIRGTASILSICAVQSCCREAVLCQHYCDFRL